MHADFSVELGRDDAALELPWSSADPAMRFYDLKKHPEWLQQIPEAMAWPELGAFLARINAAGFPLATAKCDAWASSEVTPEEEIFGDRKFVSYIDLVFEDAAARCSFEKHEAFAKTLCRLLGQAPQIPATVEVVIRRCYYYGALPDVAASEAKGGDGVAEEEVDGEGFTAEAARDRAGAGNIAEQQSGAANREHADQVAASERTRQRVDIGQGMDVGHADAGERSEADIEEVEAAGLLDVTAPDERVALSGTGGSVSGFCFTAYVTGFGDSEHEPRLRWQIALALLQNALVQLARDQDAK
jgi:hypothetical protein